MSHPENFGLEWLRNLNRQSSNPMNSLRRLGVLVLLALPCAVPPAFAQTAPTVSGVTISSSPPRQSTYQRGETIRVAVTFTAAVT